MHTKEELNTQKEEAETLNKKLRELTEEEAAQVSGGTNTYIRKCINSSCANYMVEIETTSRKCPICGSPMATALC